MKRNLTKLLSVGLLCLSFYAFGQQKPITGKVVDSNNYPVQDAYVYVEGTDNGVYTDGEGFYTIEAKKGDVIKVEFIGFDTKDIKVNDASKYNVKLSKGGGIKLGPVIATGYNTSSQDAYTGSADVIDTKSIESKSTSNIANALAGESAGVRVINSTGQPGTVGDINIRGIGSISGNTQPLYVIDGVPFTGFTRSDDDFNSDNVAKLNSMNPLASINPNDIASVTILKDATATAIYGSRGANGVVVITTKRGKSGKSVIEYQTKVGVNMSLIPRYDVISSPEEYAELSWRSLRGYAQFKGVDNPGLWASNNLFGGDQGISEFYNLWDKSGVDLIDPNTGKIIKGVKRRYTPEDWRKESFKPALRYEHNLKFSGGFDKTNFYSSLGYLKDEGSIINSDYQRLSTRLNVMHQLASWLVGSLNMGYAYSESNRNGQAEDINNVFTFSDNIPPIYPVYLRDNNGNLKVDPIFGGYQYDFGIGTKRGYSLGGNPIGIAKYNMNNIKTHDINIASSINVKFTDYLSFENRFGLQFSLFSRNLIDNPFYGAGKKQNGYIYKEKNDRLSYNLLQMLTFNKIFGSHSFNIIAAHEANWLKYNEMTGSKSNIVEAVLPEWDNAAVYRGMNSYNLSSAIESYFSQLEYGYDKKYLLSASVRRDGSSRFVNKKWGTFGAVGAGWIVSKESFMDNQHFFDYLKLKTSYGFTGEQAGVGYYPGYNLLNVGVINDKDLTINPDKIGNPDLTWQKSKMFQVGTEMRMLNSRLSLNLDYYKKTTDDMLFDKRLAPSTGNAILKVNDGELVNSGFEFDLGIKAIQKADYYLSFRLNGEILSNELTKMPIDVTTGKAKVIDVAGAYGRSEGHSIYDFYIREWAGVNKETGLAQWNLYYDDVNNNDKVEDGEKIKSLTLYLSKHENANIKQTITNNWADATMKYIGKSAIPKLRGAFNINAGYKNWDFSVQLLYSLGGYAYDGVYADLMSNNSIGRNNWHRDMLNSWTKENPNTDIPILSNSYSGQNNVNYLSTRFLTKSDYLSVNNVSLKYTFSNNVLEHIKLNGLSIYLSGDNLMLFSKRKGFNPMMDSDGSSSTYSYMPLSTVSLGLNVKF